MQAGNLILVRTDEDTQFTDALAQDVGLELNIAPITTGVAALSPGYVPEGLAAGRHCNSRLRSIKIASKENLAWEVWLFGNDLFADTDGNLERFLGLYTFAAADGKRATAGGVLDTYYHYYQDDLGIGYKDFDQTGEIHVRLVNRSAAGKTAGAVGALVVELGFEPTQGI